MQKFLSLTEMYLEYYLNSIHPWHWVALAATIFLLSLIGTKPIQVQKENGLLEIFFIKTRVALVIILVTIGLLLPVLNWILAGAIYKNIALVNDIFLKAFLDSFKMDWNYLVIGFITAHLLSFTYNRYLVPRKSALFRKFRVRQSGEELSDIRTAANEYQSKDFLPSKYYKDGFIFLGLDADDKSIYITEKEWREQNQKIIGPTQTGKGVILGVQLDQAIRKGYCSIYLDPKEDKFIPSIMKKACDDTGRKFIYLDLNSPKNKTYWHPFMGGSLRERRARIFYAFRMRDTGMESDHYKLKNREIIDGFFHEWNGTLEHLLSFMDQPDWLEESSKIRSHINEWLQIETFHNVENGEYVSIEKCLEENAVLYIRGSLDDEIIINAATILIMEVIQELKRLYSADRRAYHLFFAIDEVRFMVSDLMADGLATLVGFDAHMSIAYQSILDIRNLRDKNLNADSIEQSVKINCKTTLCYQAVDFETADWAAKETGQRLKSVTRMEKVDVKRYGTEHWDNSRTLNKTEEQLIHSNVMKMLPARVSVLFLPNQLAKILHTCWVPTDRKIIKDFLRQSTQCAAEENEALPSATPLPESVKESKMKLGKEENNGKNIPMNTPESGEIEESFYMSSAQEDIPNITDDESVLIPPN